MKAFSLHFVGHSKAGLHWIMHSWPARKSMHDQAWHECMIRYEQECMIRHEQACMIRHEQACMISHAWEWVAVKTAWTLSVLHGSTHAWTITPLQARFFFLNYFFSNHAFSFSINCFVAIYIMLLHPSTVASLWLTNWKGKGFSSKSVWRVGCKLKFLLLGTSKIKLILISFVCPLKRVSWSYLFIT